MPQLKVLYFGFPGRVEPTRLALAVGGIEFENKILTNEWAEMKPKVAPLQMPLLEVDGTLHSQSLAMFRYACKLAKVDGKPLYPEDAYEALLVDEAVDQVAEVFSGLGPTFGMKDPAEKEAARAAMVAKGGSVEKWAALIDGKLAKSTSGFVVCERLTMADLMVFTAFTLFRNGWLDGCKPDCLDHLTHLCKHKDMIANVPQVKGYYASNPNPAVACFKA